MNYLRTRIYGEVERILQPKYNISIPDYYTTIDAILKVVLDELVSTKIENEVALSILQHQPCGYMIKDEHVFCDDTRLNSDCYNSVCECKLQARIAVHAAANKLKEK